MVGEILASRNREVAGHKTIGIKGVFQRLLRDEMGFYTKGLPATNARERVITPVNVRDKQAAILRSSASP